VAFASTDQLKQKSWATREEALAELKAAGFPERGHDYELRQFNEGSWQLFPLDDVPQKGAEMPLNTGQKKSAMSRIKAAVPKQAAAKKKAAAPPKKQADVPDEGPPAVNDLSPPPNAGGPYHIRVDWAQFSIAEGALMISRACGSIAQIIGGDGKVARLIDGRLGGGRKAPSGGARQPGQVDPDSKRGRCSALLLREQGATGAELDAVIGRKAGEPFIHRLAERSKATVKKIGDRHWRLIPT